MMIKRLASLLLCTAMLFCLCACDLGGAKSYQGTMEIPADGMIKAAVFSDMKKDHAVVTFTGQSGDIRYEWTVFGDDIDKAADTNLAVTIEMADKEKVAVSFASEVPFDFFPVLSVYLNTQWDAQNATVYDIENKAVCGASVTGKTASILNFSVTESPGTFFIVPDHEADTEVSDSSDVVQGETGNIANAEKDPYLTTPESGGNRVISDGKETEQDKYLTDPVPEGKPKPVEPEDQDIDTQKTYTCTFSIECTSILNHMSDLNPDKVDALPSDGIILSRRTVTFYEGESVYDVLQRVCKENGIQMEASWTPIYNSAYVEGIHNLYEFDCGSGSGWMYRVNGWYPNYGCSRYQLVDGEVVEWRYTCELGSDIGGGYAMGS